MSQNFQILDDAEHLTVAPNPHMATEDEKKMSFVDVRLRKLLPLLVIVAVIFFLITINHIAALPDILHDVFQSIINLPLALIFQKPMTLGSFFMFTFVLYTISFTMGHNSSVDDLSSSSASAGSSPDSLPTSTGSNLPSSAEAEKDKTYQPQGLGSNLTSWILFFIALFYFGVFFMQNVHRVQDSGSDSLNAAKFVKYFMAGGVCALFTHAAFTPIDVVKTRIQTNPTKYGGPISALKTILHEEGFGSLLKGLGATATGYFLHGAFKYSFYEVFKVILSDKPDLAVNPSFKVAAFAGFFAECIAGLFLCPLEAIRIRSVADSTFPSDVVSGLMFLYRSEGFFGLYKGLPSILLKQVPYTVTQFAVFEYALKLVKYVLAFFGGNAEQVSAGRAAMVAVLAGFLSGIAAAITSQPGDTILSKINQEQSEGTAGQQIWRIAQKLGFRGLFLGLETRIIHVACMIGGQFMIYDSIKLFFGIIPASAMTTSQLQKVKKVN